MDFNAFFPGQHFNYINGAIPLQAAFQEEPSKISNSGETGEPDVFDHSAMFQTPYDAFRFGQVVPSQDMGDISMSIHPTAEDAQIPAPAQNQDVSDSQAAENASRHDRPSSSEENRLTPAQSKRKAQNRAAQRAFRERKERHVKELETKLTSLESSATKLALDNQRLKLAMQQIMTENELLRTSNGVRGSRARMLSKSKQREFSPSSGREGASGATENEEGRAAGGYSPFHEESDPEKAADAGVMLNKARAWDYIVEHPLVRAGRVDIKDTVDRLNRSARPGSRGGPIFSERDVRKAIEKSKRAGGDALI